MVAREGPLGCEGLTRKGDKVDGVIGKGRKAGKRGKNKCKWTHEERKVWWECVVRW